MKQTFTALAIYFFSWGAIASDSLESEEQTKLLADEIMASFYAEKFDAGLELAKPYWPLPEVEIDSLANQIKLQWGIVEQRFGTSLGTEFVRKEAIGDSFVRYIYLHKFENHAIHWEVIFYRPIDEWRINSIQFRDQFSHLFR